MAIYLSVPFDAFDDEQADNYNYTHVGAASDPGFVWHSGDGSASSISGTAESYTVTWSGAEEWAHRFLPTGGYAGGGCAHLIQRDAQDQYQLGWVTNGSNFKTWGVGDVVYVRFRIKYDDIFRWDGESTMQNKMVDWGAESGGGNRVIAMNEMPHTGDVCTINSATYDEHFSGFSVKQGIGGAIGDNLCTPGYVMTHGVWYHLQFGVQTSSTSTGFHKLWVNNNTVGSPDTSWLNRNIGVSSWNDSWDFGGFISETPTRDQGWKISHLEIGNTFDAGWYPGGGGGGSPRVFGVRA